MPLQDPLRRRPQAPHRALLPEAESDGLMRQLAGYSSSLLQTGLDVLDKPGRAVRGVLGGHFRELGNLVPFSDTIGLTDEADRLSGRDLLEKAGLAGRTSHGWGATVAGLAAEVALDPLTYATFGAKNALTPVGRKVANAGALRGWTRGQLLRGFDDSERLLQAAGKTPDEIAHMTAQGRRIAPASLEAAIGEDILPNRPLGALAGLGSPFGAASTLIGQGPTAIKLADLMDRVGRTTKYDTTIGRWLNANFDSNVGEMRGGRTQEAMARYGTPAIEAARIGSREDTYKILSAIDAARGSGADEEDILRAARQHAEGVSFRGTTPASEAAAPSIADLVRHAEDAQLAEARKWGIPLPDASDGFTRYAPRAGIDIEAIKGADPRRSGMATQVVNRNNLPVVAGDSFARKKAWRDLPGGTEMVNDIVRRFAGNAAGRPIPDIANDIGHMLRQEMLSTHTPMSPDLHKFVDDKSMKLARRVAKLDPLHAEEQVGLFSPQLASDLARSGEQHARKVGSVRAIMGFLGDNARVGGNTADGSHVPVSRVLSDLGLLTRTDADGLVREGAMIEAYRSLAKKGAAPVDSVVGLKRKALRGTLDQFTLPRALHEELVASHGKWSMPEVLKEPMGLFSNVTRAFKNLAYPTWPASHVRNAVSAGLNNLLRGTSAGDHALQFKLMRGTATADELRRALPGLPAGLSDDEAREFARRQQFASGKVYNGHAGQSDLDAHYATSFLGGGKTTITPLPFGSDRAGAGTFAQDTRGLILGGIKRQIADIRDFVATRGQTPNPLRMEGVFGGTENFPALEVGRKVGTNIEDFFRGANFLGNTRKGMSPTMAGLTARDIHFDYDALTNFEKKVMRQVIPFYTFARKNSAAQLENLVRSPGSVIAQMRAMASGRDEDGYTPNYLAAGGAVPVGEEEGGMRRYISGFGTPLEEALSRFQFKGGMPDAKHTLLQIASSMNPLIKGPLEQVFDTQFHTGRPLSSLRPQGTASAIGRLVGEDNPQLLAQILANTPATRFISSIDKLMDDRKGVLPKLLNLGTGVKVTDVDVEKTRSIEAAQARNELLSRMPHVRGYTTYYPAKGQADQLEPDEVRMLRMLATMQQAARDRIGGK